MTEDVQQFEKRKKEHIELALDGSYQAVGLTGLERVQLEHDSLPEIDFSEVVLNTQSLGKSIKTPFVVSSMTAGHADAKTFNFRIARACSKQGWAFAVGSQRRELQSSDSVDEWERLRGEFSELEIFGNIGASQLANVDIQKIVKMVEVLKPQGFFVHLNSLQEVLQPEGTPQFRGVVYKINELAKQIQVPVLIKETGCGFSRRSFEKINNLSVAAIDVSGLGGTHWGRIEGARAHNQTVTHIAAETFQNWGNSLVDSLLAAIDSNVKCEVWASGGVRSGLDAAKVLAMRAGRVGIAQPILKAAFESEAAIEKYMQQIEFELKIALFCTGSKNIAELQEKKLWKLNTI